MSVVGYTIKPSSRNARLQLNQKPEKTFSQNGKKNVGNPVIVSR